MPIRSGIVVLLLGPVRTLGPIVDDRADDAPVCGTHYPILAPVASIAAHQTRAALLDMLHQDDVNTAARQPPPEFRRLCGASISSSSSLHRPEIMDRYGNRQGGVG